jgi:hypothetical protein
VSTSEAGIHKSLVVKNTSTHRHSMFSKMQNFTSISLSLTMMKFHMTLFIHADDQGQMDEDGMKM